MEEMNQNKEAWYVRSSDGQVYGPTDRSSLVVWAEEGRIEPSGFVSRDRKEWIPAQLMPELEMKWVVEAEPGKFFGPFNRKMIIRLASSGSLPAGAGVYRRHELAVDKDPPPVTVEKRVEVPVEKIVEKIVEKRVEVPVEKIVERIIEVEPPARSAMIAPEVAASAPQPPQPVMGGIFKNVDPSRLAALEAAARRELAAAKGGRFGGVKGLFSRRMP